MKIGVDMGETVVLAQVWEARVGRTPLYLLDTNIPENGPDQQAITATLYPGDRDMRIRQEILLGVGGIRALRALGINPAVTHMNEGHSAFLLVERIRDLMHEEGLSFQEARRGGLAHHRLHHPHPRAGRQRALRHPADAALLRRRSPASWGCPGRTSSPWAGRTRTTSRSRSA